MIKSLHQKIKLLSSGLAAVLVMGSSVFAYATPDEGMWLPVNIKRLNHVDMQKKGLKLTAEELYNVNNSSLKDAIVRMGQGFCTGEMISKDGLLLTNHHCGYDYIQGHSSVEKDYLSKGFFAMNKGEELTNPGLTVSFLVKMEDVTTRVLANVNDEMTEPQRAAAVSTAIKAIRDENEKGTGYSAEVKAFFNGNEFYLLVYETYRDVRLVAAPPSSIGKYGGDTDNWMWPRHTGDFSMFRVYAGKDNKPADYSKDNVPYKPKHHLPVSMTGVKKGDYAMIWGYPGRTDRYLTSYGVNMATELSNPMRVKLRRKKLDLMEEDMNTDPAVRIKYSSKHAQISNYWKYFIGETQGLKRLKVADKKKAEETAFTNWVNADAKRKAKYGSALELISKSYGKMQEFQASQINMQEAVYGVEVLQVAQSAGELEKLLSAKPVDEAKVKEAAANIMKQNEEIFKDYNAPTDKKLLTHMVRMFAENVSPDQRPKIYETIDGKFKKDYSKYADFVFEKTVFADKAKLAAFLEKPSLSKLQKDPAYQAINSYYGNYVEKIVPSIRSINSDLERGNRLYVGGTMEMQKSNRVFYPNANSTMRCTFGTVEDYKARDAVEYNYYTTIDGIIEKEDPTNPEFEVPARLKELWQKKDYGRYAENGELRVAFLTNTDITGGNSGSPVINSRGELIGLAFDGNWEAMSGNIAFEPALQRTISNDIRYVLWVLDKYANAKHLVDEMTLVYNKDPEPVMAPVAAPVAPIAPAAPMEMEPLNKKSDAKLIQDMKKAADNKQVEVKKAMKAIKPNAAPAVPNKAN